MRTPILFTPDAVSYFPPGLPDIPWFDADTGKIAEIRAYDAAPADKTARINELVAFDYAGRGYHLKSE